jgi:phosphate transport system substrate-binding protein
MRTIMRKRKLFAIAMSVMCTAALMTGCGSSNGASSSDAGSGADTGSASQPISVVSREDGSGTRGAFVELTGVEEKDADGNKTDNTTADAIISNSTEIMMTTVSGDEYAIGYSSTGSLNDTVKALNVDGVEPTAQNIKDGKYSLSRPFNIATKGTPGKLAQDFIDYILSEEGQKVVEDNGYIASVDDAKAFKSSGESGKLVVAGSSSVTPVMEKLAEAYKAVNKKAEIEIQESDSTTGMTAAADGTCDIGMASRELEDSEKDKGLTSQAIALDGIAVIVNTQNTRTEITTDMVKKIFTGEVTDWNDVTE